jgi:DNA polymerase delta subunit 1
VARAAAFLKETLETLAHGRVDIKDLVVSKALKKWNYVNPQPHSVLAEKLKARNPADPPRLGDRIPFVILQGDDPKMYNRAEDPAYALARKLKIDVAYYIHQQMKKPFLRIFEQIIGEEESLKLFQGLHVVPRDGSNLAEWVVVGKTKSKRPFRVLAPEAPKKKRRKRKLNLRPITDYLGIK